MLRLVIAVCVGTLLAFGGVPMLPGQATSYDDNSLRIENRRGDMLVVRGATGNPVGKIGMFRGLDLQRLVGSSEKATVEAGKFVRDYRPGMLLVSVGIVAMGAAFAAGQVEGVNHGITIALTLTGI